MEDPLRLARAVKDARERADETQPSVTNRARSQGHRISIQTWRNIEQGRNGTYFDTTLAAVDAGLGWEPGTAKRILRGEDYEPITQTEDTTIAARLAAVEARLRAAGSDIQELSPLDALVVVLHALDDDQYNCVLTAVAADPRYQTSAP